MPNTKGLTLWNSTGAATAYDHLVWRPLSKRERAQLRKVVDAEVEKRTRPYRNKSTVHGGVR